MSNNDKMGRMKMLQGVLAKRKKTKSLPYHEFDRTKGPMGPKGTQGSKSSNKTRRGWGDASDAEAYDQWQKDVIAKERNSKKGR